MDKMIKDDKDIILQLNHKLAKQLSIFFIINVISTLVIIIIKYTFYDGNSRIFPSFEWFLFIFSMIISFLFMHTTFFGMIKRIKFSQDTLLLQKLYAFKFSHPCPAQQILAIQIDQYNYSQWAWFRHKPAKIKHFSDRTNLLDADINHLITIYFHPKMAQQLNTNHCILLSDYFDDLSPLFEWCQNHDIKIEQGKKLL